MRHAWTGAGSATFAGVVAALVFPTVGAWPLAPVALVPAAVALRSRSSVAGGLAWGLVFGLAHQVALGTWLVESLVQIFDLGWRVGLAVSAWVALLCAWPYAVFGGLAIRLRGSRLPTWLGFAMAFAVAEVLRSVGPSPLPWLRLGDALVAFPAALQGAAWFGVAGLSFLLAASAAACVEAWASRRMLSLLGVALALSAVVGLGALRIDRFEADGPVVRVALVQIATPQARRFQPETRQAHLAAQLEATRGAVEQGASLVVWSETALDFLPKEVPDVEARIAEALGGNAERGLLAGRWLDEGEGRTSNAVTAFSGAGVPLGHYRKQVLVPWAERAPSWLDLGSRLRRRLKQLVTDVSYVAGTSAEPLPVAGIRAGVLVCYESLFEGLARKTVARGADVLVNVSNDAFFPTRGAEQHAMLAAMRAVEQGRPLVRVSNRGVGGVVDPTGRWQVRLAATHPARAVVEIQAHRGATPYARGGHLFDDALLVVALGFCLPRARRSST